MNAAPRRFCTEESLAAGEPLAGTGIHPARNILIRWPKGRWQHSTRIASGMEGAVEQAIGRVVEAGWRVNLIDRKGEPDESLRVYLYPEGVTAAVAPEALPALLDAIISGEDLTRFGMAPADRPLVLCCTHGRHDRCCAKWGFAVYRALAAEARSRGGFEVWEATHLGGCRLSAGVLVLPSLRKYGRLSPADAPALLAAEAEDRPYLPCYRGASHLEKPAQIAEVEGRRALAERGHAGSVTVTETAPGVYAVAADTATAEVRLAAAEDRNPSTCARIDEAQPLEPRATWRARVTAIRRGASHTLSQDH